MTSDDPFALLGLPRGFELDPSALQAAYLRASARVHPDKRHEPAGALEAAADAARINDARQMLADDERRADALLRVLGGPPKDRVKDLPDGFLLDIMGTRETMEAAIESRDPQQLAALQGWAEERRREFAAAIALLFADHACSNDAALLREVRVQLNAWRYIERMLEQLDPDDRPAL